MPQDDYGASSGLIFPHKELIIFVRHILLFCLFALLIMSGETAAAVGRTPESGSFHRFFRPAMMSVPGWTSLALITSLWSRIRHSSFEQPLNLRDERNFLLISGLIDLVLTGALITLTVLQTYFLPHPLGKCLKEGLREIGDHDYGRSYFDAIASREGREVDENGVVSGNARHSWCNRFVNNWRFQIAIIIMMGFSALSCLYASLLRTGAGSRAKKRHSNRIKELLHELEAVKTGPQIEGIAPSKSVNKGTSKIACGNVEIPKQSLPTPIVPAPGSTKPSGDEYLQKILGQYELLRTITYHLHCSDIESILFLSRGIRAAVIGTGVSRKALVHSSLCGTSNLSEAQIWASRQPRSLSKTCLACGAFLCPKCSWPPYEKSLRYETIRHLRDCKPNCDTCYQKKYCFAPRTSAKGEGYMLPAKCAWNNVAAHTRQIPDPVQPEPPSNPEESSPPIAYIDILASDVHSTSVRVCPGCQDLPDPMFLSMKRYRSGSSERNQRMCLTEVDESSFYKQSRYDLKCGNCARRMHSGERLWWICIWCKKECTADHHKHMQELIVP